MGYEHILYTRTGIKKRKINELYPIWYSMTKELIHVVKEKRSQLGLTQEELADRAGVGLRFVRDMEQGKESLRLDKVNQVLSLFGMKMVPAKDEYEEG